MTRVRGSRSAATPGGPGGERSAAGSRPPGPGASDPASGPPAPAAEDASGEDAAGEDASGEDAAGDVASGEDAPGEDAAGGTGDVASGEDAPGEDAAGGTGDEVTDDRPGDAGAGKESGRPGRIGRPRGPRRSRDERRAELLDAAERAIRRIGPQASMDELAAEAGITKPILYSHFGDKAGLAGALTERVAAELGEAISDSLERVQHPEQVVSSTIDAFCSFIETETELYHFLWHTALTQGGDADPKMMMVGFANQIAYALGSALRQVGADSGAAEPWSYAIVGMTLTAGEWWLRRRSMSRDDLVAYLTQLLWGGLAGAGFDRLGPLFSVEDAGDESTRDEPAANVTPITGRAGGPAVPIPPSTPAAPGDR
ncbi:MAG TPA: TetR family transcriptional regulator [Acidimicrobiales bacterium]|nr:TetR family transcriptional regulator [Acidimicrobiales bacterium]